MMHAREAFLRDVLEPFTSDLFGPRHICPSTFTGSVNVAEKVRLIRRHDVEKEDGAIVTLGEMHRVVDGRRRGLVKIHWCEDLSERLHWRLQFFDYPFSKPHTRSPIAYAHGSGYPCLPIYEIADGFGFSNLEGTKVTARP